ncbi:MAG: hypothetical protein OXH27_00475 [Gammaproteobacteria bacterium]|nr:hypothetical protein [Gammaproteobacteria bacterium]MCY3690235.1 hypothetical protein [Gammaproteobacteria bacterium]MDE0478464.1 hypothetical protein [Gammaproteobacteria bacterium]
MKSPPLILAALLFALAAVGAYLLLDNGLWFGRQDLLIRAVLFLLPALAALTAAWIPLRAHAPRAARLLALFYIPVLFGGFGYFLFWMPRFAESVLSIDMVEQRLITDSSSNALVEIGFAFPIFTPTVELRNGELFSREVDIYLRMIDSDGRPMLYRAVREEVPPGTLSVEATVRGMLSANERYLFLPVRLAPGEEATGRLVFVITALDEGASFMGEMRRANLAQFELRDAIGGELLLEVPVER